MASELQTRCTVCMGTQPCHIIIRQIITRLTPDHRYSPCSVYGMTEYNLYNSFVAYLQHCNINLYDHNSHDQHSTLAPPTWSHIIIILLYMDIYPGLSYTCRHVRAGNTVCFKHLHQHNHRICPLNTTVNIIITSSTY